MPTMSLLTTITAAPRTTRTRFAHSATLAARAAVTARRPIDRATSARARSTERAAASLLSAAAATWEQDEQARAAARH